MSSLRPGQEGNAYHGKFQSSVEQAKNWLRMIILNSDLLHGTVHHPTKFQADSKSGNIVRDGRTDRRTSLENLISAAMKQAAPHTCFFFLVFFI